MCSDLPLPHGVESAEYLVSRESPARSDCRNTLIYEHTISHIFPTCDMSLGSLNVGMPEAGDFVKLFEPYLDGLAKPTINLTVNIQTKRLPYTSPGSWR